MTNETPTDTPQAEPPKVVHGFDYCSDIDGVRFAVCGADNSDMAGWAVEETTGGGRLLRLRWGERGGPRVVPPVPPPAGRGFGVAFVEGAARHELDGRAELTFAPEGLAAEIETPLPG